MVPVAVDLPLSPSNVECAIQAAVRNGVPPDLVLALRAVEAGHAGTATRNDDGSYDFGEAAINSVKFPELAQKGYDPQRLVSDGCYAMDAKAFIVREHLVNAPPGTP
ncbi:MAG: hypothetical protein JNM52_09845, partial [Betaproteobacteria bacterium]|nr:hypothetical protein [Betaproteobacteria bacterium]